jgi:nitric oxide dioxygenase
VTPEQIVLVREVVTGVGAHPEFAERFYGRLFDVAPATRPMFGDVEAQQGKLTAELVALLELIEDLPGLSARAAELGERHRGYGVRAPHYRVARQVMLDTLDEVLGAEFDAEHRAAWERATMLVTELMQA